VLKTICVLPQIEVESPEFKNVLFLFLQKRPTEALCKKMETNIFE
jgi:hypothetical protein